MSRMPIARSVFFAASLFAMIGGARVASAASTMLLFPFATNQIGFDTGITLANTSSDPYGTTPQAGTCVINFYGSGAPSPAQYTTPSIVPGQIYVTALSTVAPGFQGYVIATCNFPLARGSALLSSCTGGGPSIPCVDNQTSLPAEIITQLPR